MKLECAPMDIPRMNYNASEYRGYRNIVMRWPLCKVTCCPVLYFWLNRVNRIMARPEVVTLVVGPEKVKGQMPQSTTWA